MICAVCGDFYFIHCAHECSYHHGSNYEDYEATAWWCDCCGKFINPVVASNSFERHCECGEFTRPRCASQIYFREEGLSLSQPEESLQGPRTPDREPHNPDPVERAEERICVALHVTDQNEIGVALHVTDHYDELRPEYAWSTSQANSSNEDTI